jgi:hypothetical protein
MAMDERGFIGKMLLLTGGLLIWALHFTLLYGFNTLACARRFADHTAFGISIVHLVIGAVTALALAATIAILARAAVPSGHAGSTAGPGDRFVSHAAAVVASLSLLAIVWNALPAFVVRAC